MDKSYSSPYADKVLMKEKAIFPSRNLTVLPKSDKKGELIGIVDRKDIENHLFKALF